MGDPIPKETEWGNECYGCSGLCFEPDQTPKYMGIALSGVEPCGSTPDEIPNGHLFILLQSESDACDWSAEIIFDDNYYEIYLYLHEPDHRLMLDFFMNFLYRIFTVPDLFEACQIVIPNKHLSCGPSGVGGAGGSCSLMWGPDINEEAFLAQEFA